MVAAQRCTAQLQGCSLDPRCPLRLGRKASGGCKHYRHGHEPPLFGVCARPQPTAVTTSPTIRSENAGTCADCFQPKGPPRQPGSGQAAAGQAGAGGAASESVASKTAVQANPDQRQPRADGPKAAAHLAAAGVRVVPTADYERQRPPRF